MDEMTRGEQPESPAPQLTETAVVPVPEEVDVQESGEREVALAAPFDAERMIVPRPRKRLNIDQLRASMLQVSGGIDWTEGQWQSNKIFVRRPRAHTGSPRFRGEHRRGLRAHFAISEVSWRRRTEYLSQNDRR